MDAVEVFNRLPAARLEAQLRACCAAPGWGAAVLAKRPYRERLEIIDAGDAAARALSWDEVRVALSAHPRIGERASGDSAEASWSRQEQAAAARSADELTKAALADANRAYESRFGQVFLIFANGRTQEEILAEARERLANDEDTERVIVADELRKIALLRLERVLDALR
jgi:2-oxo-4-hydroxy-4-carboxy-5-ureidoimidazoline decarboxylase